MVLHYTLNHCTARNPEFRKPTPDTRNLKPGTLNPKPETRNPKPETRKHAPGVLDRRGAENVPLEVRHLVPRFGFRSRVSVFGFGFRAQDFGFRMSGSDFWVQGFGSWMSLGFRPRVSLFLVSCLGLQGPCPGSRIPDSGFNVQCFVLRVARVPGPGFRILRFGRRVQGAHRDKVKSGTSQSKS